LQGYRELPMPEKLLFVYFGMSGDKSIPKAL